MSGKIYLLSSEEREFVAEEIGKKNRSHDSWVLDSYENRKFIEKWSSLKWEKTPKGTLKRKLAYTKRFNTGKDLHVQHNVDIHREHFLWGTISIGDNVVLAKNVFIDYTGEVVIEDNVKLANGVIIESHHRDLEAYNEGKDVNIPTKLIIRENAYIGSRAMILDSCNYIGKNARVGAGAVVTKDVPDYAVAVGVPAKVVRYTNQ